MQKIINYGSFAAIIILVIFAYIEYNDRKKCNCGKEKPSESERPTAES